MPLQTLTFTNYNEVVGVINGLGDLAAHIRDNEPTYEWPITVHIANGKVGKNQPLQGHAEASANAGLG